MSSSIGRTLGGFQHRVACRLENMNMKRDVTGKWIYLPLETGMMEVGLEEMETYILRHHNTISQYITTRKILELCMASE